MQFQSSNKRVSSMLSKARDLELNDNCNADHLNMYTTPPAGHISLTEFDEIAVERLQLLKKFEDIKLRFKKEEQRVEIYKQVIRNMPAKNSPSEVKRRDVIGHFILRLAFCKSAEDTKWFVNLETDLFKVRFLEEKKSEHTTFFKNNKFNITAINEEEKADMAVYLAGGSGMEPSEVASKDFWKTDMMDVLELVRNRRVYLRRGFAYLPDDDLLFIVMAQMRANMNGAMARARRFLGDLEEDERIMPRLERLANNAYFGKEYAGEDGNAVTRQMINALSKSSFPLCMSVIHNRMRNDHHLKHGARRQYGLFLKAIGLSLDEALAFFREEFSIKLDSDKFEKQYAYNIRHMYGKEGCRKEYTAFSCTKIVLGNPPAVGDCHGCPYKHMELETLKQHLDSSGLSAENVSQLITHPNEYYEKMQQVLAGKRSKEGVTTTEMVVKASQPEVKEDIEEELMEFL